MIRAGETLCVPGHPAYVPAKLLPEEANAGVAGQNQTAALAFPYVFRWDRKGRKGQRCAMIVRSHAQNSCLLRFSDGFEMVTSRNAVVRAAGMKNSVSVARKEARLKYPSLPDSAVEQGATAHTPVTLQDRP